MLYLLSELKYSVGVLRLFDYVTFRAGGAALTAFLIVLLFGKQFARYLSNLNVRSAERLEGLVPVEFIDKEKSRTPCMGGILIVGAIIISGLLWNDLSSGISLSLLMGVFLFCAIGFIDDYCKVVKKNRDGISGRCKLILQTIVAALVLASLMRVPHLRESLLDFMVPFAKTPVCRGWWVLIFEILVIVGASNAVNLTDGKDGLASGCTIFSALTYATFAYLMGHKIFANYLNIPFVPDISEAVVFSAALGGACIGFLWHNCHPASMFMGDTGSLALGGALGMLAVITRQELLLLLVGSVFVLEAVSVMIQVASFRLFGKRVFLCTPIHHHFERLNWTETQIVVRFWIISGVCALLALATLKLR
ncbi:MAG: phospho-N-acetylmuramoyl-pentapeptide-transferase [Lentisphaeria bacterium]|jgi:phospho-N-acetylmuramoyl-pentapeptide-transferase|nr:phospho-N-acetylmuramoyl-pentapeptide-transferase [Lentisphaeria bacterium]MBO7152682.1 phospho-N-acetylmuramoyl-pentapeptide-transferase [Lentisphaeria bacterium]